MNFDAVSKTISKNKPRLTYDDAVKSGRPAYRNNRNVLRLFDITKDRGKGRIAAETLIDQIDLWIIAIGKIANAAKKIKQSAESVKAGIRSTKDDS